MLILVLHRGYQQCLKMSQIRFWVLLVYMCVFFILIFWYVVLWWWQIRLWESDLNRVEMTESYYYDEFPSRVSNFDSVSLSIHCYGFFDSLCHLCGRMYLMVRVTAPENGVVYYGKIQRRCIWWSSLMFILMYEIFYAAKSSKKATHSDAPYG